MQAMAELLHKNPEKSLSYRQFFVTMINRDFVMKDTAFNNMQNIPIKAVEKEQRNEQRLEKYT